MRLSVNKMSLFSFLIIRSTLQRREFCVHSCVTWHEETWFGLLTIYVALAVFQPYRDLEAGDNQSLKIQVARRGIEPRTSCSASQELNHSATAAPDETRAKRALLRFS